MKIVLFLGLVLSWGLFGSEHEFRDLLARQNNQTMSLIFAMSVVGIHGLIKNSEQICPSEGPYCWQVVAPVVALPVLSGYLMYKKLTWVKGQA